MAHVYKLYDLIYKKYVFFNFFITLGLDRYWRRICLKKIYSVTPKPRRVLDICAGTGDMTMLLEKKFNSAEIYALDANKNMLSIAEKRLRRTHLVNSQLSDMPFDDNFFDLIVISFATRNIFYDKDLNSSLREIKRVLKNGGFFISLETTNYESSFMNFFMNIYVSTMIGIVNFFNPNYREAYMFLKSSSLRFNAMVFADKLKNFFSDVCCVKLFPGCASIHISKK